MSTIHVRYEPTIPLTDEAMNWLLGTIGTGLHEKETVERFYTLMVEELAANAVKGNRVGWLQMSPAEAVAELLYHAGKLSLAVREVGSDKDPDPRTAGFILDDVREYAADVANCALMVLDCTELNSPEASSR